MGVVNGKSMKSMMNTEVLLFSNKHVYLETHTQKWLFVLAKVTFVQFQYKGEEKPITCEYKIICKVISSRGLNL
uniref:Uncharacterized protein n=1 Tax=Anguilla anguilla TaxID=7936 RepID=A0A0E9XDH0_ANGAN